VNRLGHLSLSLLICSILLYFTPLDNYFVWSILIVCSLIPDFDLLARKLKWRGTKIGFEWVTDPRWHRWIVTHSSLFAILGTIYTLNYTTMNPTDLHVLGYFCFSYSSHMFGDLTKGVKSSIVVIPKLGLMKKSIRLRSHWSTVWLIANGLTLITIGTYALWMVK